MVPHLVAGDFLVGVAGGLVTGEICLAIAVYQIRERDRIRGPRGAYDSGQADGHRWIAISESRYPLRCGSHRPARGRTGMVSLPAAAESGRAGGSAASNWMPSTCPLMSTRSTPPRGVLLMVITMTSPRA